MAKYIVNCKDSSVQLGCKLGQFTFKKGEIIENDMLALTFPNLFIRLAEPLPVPEQPIVFPILDTADKELLESLRQPKERKNLIPPPVEAVVAPVEEIKEEVVEEPVIEEEVVAPVEEVKVEATQEKRHYKKGYKGK